MRVFSKVFTLGGVSALFLAGVANAAPVPSAVKLIPEESVSQRVGTIYSTPLKAGETPFLEVFEVTVTGPPEPVYEPEEPEPSEESEESEDAASRSSTHLSFEEEAEVSAEAPPEPEAPAENSTSSSDSSSSSSSSSESSGEDSGASTSALYSLSDLMFQGVIHWGGYKFTYYSQSVLPGGGLVIPGRHVSSDGYVVDGDGYIALAGSAPKGTVYPTPFGRSGKIYDRGTTGNHLDVYTK